MASFCGGVVSVEKCQEQVDSNDMRTVVDMQVEGLLETIKTRFDKKTVLSIFRTVRGRGVVVQHVGLSSRRSRVQIPSRPPIVKSQTPDTTKGLP
jgi:hypothetical protein